MAYQGKKNKLLPRHTGSSGAKASGNVSAEMPERKAAGKSSAKAFGRGKRVSNAVSAGGVLKKPAPSAAKKGGQEAGVPKKWEPFYRKLLRLQTLLSDGSAAPEEGDEELLDFVTDRSKALAEVRAAIDRIFKGTYGICELTRRPIALERLEVLPCTRYSLKGQQQAEALRSDVFASEEASDEDRDEEEPLSESDDLTDE